MDVYIIIICLLCTFICKHLFIEKIKKNVIKYLDRTLGQASPTVNFNNSTQNVEINPAADSIPTSDNNLGKEALVKTEI